MFIKSLDPTCLHVLEDKSMGLDWDFLKQYPVFICRANFSIRGDREGMIPINVE
jgi:hypothetical protein